ncbi:hypothetical protein [Mediterraneibacter gnavus]|uniref:hypothetical protein n=1 Tax=Mediterraneibacter gnavus TaxID=33038 RepID=UPI0036D43CEE
MNALIVYGSNYNVAVYCSINYVPKSKKSEFVERFPELSPFFKACRAFYDEMICIFPYFCPYAESAREIRGIFVALHQ